MQEEPQTIHELVEKYRKKYQAQNPVFSPALKSIVYFTAEGFNHLLYKHGHKRSAKDMKYRLPLIKHIHLVIKNCSTISRREISEESYKGKRVTVSYFELIEIVDQKNPIKVKVVVKRRESFGKLIFQSVMKQKTPKRRSLL